MSRVSELRELYRKHSALPWRPDESPMQRVVLGVYLPADERRLRATVSEFETATKLCGHGWRLLDIESAFGDWLGEEEYAEEYFDSPQTLPSYTRRKFLPYLEGRIRKDAGTAADDPNAVVAIMGTGALFGLQTVKELVEKVAPFVKGRLLVFFPGTYTNNNLRLLDGYDGWDYLAIVLGA